MPFQNDPLLSAVLSMALPLVLAVVVLAAYWRLRLRSLLWLAGYELWAILIYTLLRDGAYGWAALVVTQTISFGLLLVFLIVVAREIRGLSATAQTTPSPPGGEGVGPSR